MPVPVAGVCAGVLLFPRCRGGVMRFCCGRRLRAEGDVCGAARRSPCRVRANAPHALPTTALQEGRGLSPFTEEAARAQGDVGLSQVTQLVGGKGGREAFQLPG